MKVTIVDVAKRANVSITTVTHSLNGKRPVSNETKLRVKKAIAELCYVPSYSASHLKTSKSGFIGCYVTDITADFTAFMLRGIEKVIKGTGYSLIFASGVDIGTGKEDIATYFRKFDVDGLLMINHLSTTSNLPEGGFANFPIVFINTENKHYDSVLPDDIGAGEIVAQHLFDCGVRNPVFLGGPQERISVQKRLKGFKQKLSSLGVLIPETAIHFGEFTYESGFEMAGQLLDSQEAFDGLFCANDFIGVGAMRRCLQEGKSIPKDIKIVGFDDRDVGRYCSIPLTTVKQNLEDLGMTAIERILSKIKSKKDSCGIFYSAPQLIIRESTQSQKV